MASPAVFLPALTCGGGMALCMYLMSRSHKGANNQEATGADHDAGARDTEVAELRQEVERLRSEVRSRDDLPA